MSKVIDACGLSCPQPVFLTLAALKAGGDEEVVVLVDNEAARENVSRAARSRGWAVARIDAEAGDRYRLTLKK